MMKRILLISLAVLAAAACKKITPEQQVSKIAEFLGGYENEYVTPLTQHDTGRRLDYLTLVLNRDLDANSIWTLETGGGTSLNAEFPGREKNKQISLISASIDDPAACAAALGILRAFKEQRLNTANTLRLLVYDNTPDSLGVSGLESVIRDYRASEELITFDLELSTCDTLPNHTFIMEEKPVFVEKILEVIPPYFKQLGDYQFVQGEYPNHDWPLKSSVYRYRIDPGDLPRETAAAAALTLLLN